MAEHFWLGMLIVFIAAQRILMRTRGRKLLSGRCSTITVKVS